MHLQKLLQITKDLVWLVTKGDQQGYWKHVENIQKEYLERDGCSVRHGQHIIRMNPDGDGEHESSDTNYRSNCSSSEDMNL